MKTIIREILNEYVELEEAKFRDLLDFNDSFEGNLAKQVRSHTDKVFENDRPLLNYMTFDGRFNNKKVRGNIQWNDRSTHNLHKRIKERTSFLTITEFNDTFKSAMNHIFPESIGGLVKGNGRYGLHLIEENITIIFNVNLKDIMKGNIEIYVVTVLPGKLTDHRKVLGVIEF